MTEPLDNLASAIAKRRYARETVTQTKAALERGRELLATEAARSSKFDNLDVTVTQYRAGKIKQWINGHTPKPDGDEPLPNEFKVQLLEKRAAEENLAAVHQAVEQLVDDARAASNALTQAQQEVELCAVEVLRIEGERAAKELIECQDKAFALSQSLSALCRMWTSDKSGRRQAFPAGDLVLQALNRPDLFLTQQSTSVEREAGLFWERRLATLSERDR